MTAKQIKKELVKIIDKQFHYLVSYEFAMDKLYRYIDETIYDITYKFKFGGKMNYKLDTFGDSIIAKCRYRYTNSKKFDSTIVYHIDYNEPQGSKRVPIKEYVVVKLDYDAENMAFSSQESYINAMVFTILDIANGFQSTLYCNIDDNINFTKDWVRENVYNCIHKRQYKLFTIISQTDDYSVALLITQSAAIVYSLPTSTLSNSETHIEEILVLDSLREQLGLEDTVTEGVTRVVQKDEIEFGWDTTKPSIREVYE